MSVVSQNSAVYFVFSYSLLSSSSNRKTNI